MLGVLAAPGDLRPLRRVVQVRQAGVIKLQVWRMADVVSAREPLRGHDGWVSAVAAGALPDGTPVITSDGPGPVRVWRLADGARCLRD